VPSLDTARQETSPGREGGKVKVRGRRRTKRRRDKWMEK
jgi:hypothetical protein